MSQASANISDTDRQHMAEPTKYIVRCCEMRKRREIKTEAIASRQRIRVRVEN